MRIWLKFSDLEVLRNARRGILDPLILGYFSSSFTGFWRGVRLAGVWAGINQAVGDLLEQVLPCRFKDGVSALSEVFGGLFDFHVGFESLAFYRAVEEAGARSCGILDFV